jgi:hypothetical protein
VLLLSDDGAALERANCFRDAIDLVRRQGAKSWNCARRQAGRVCSTNEGAATKPADIYHGFTEGFDTADLKDAHALLDELSV